MKELLIRFLAEKFNRFNSEVEGNALKVRIKFALDIQDQMIRQGISNRVLAVRTGLAESYISKVLNAKTNLEAATILKIAKAVGCTAKFQLAEKKEEAK